MGLLKNKDAYISSLSNITPNQRKLTTGAILLLVLSLWFFFIYSSTKRKITNNKKLLYQVLKKKQLLEKSKNKCQRIEKKIKYLKSDIQNYSNNKNLKASAQSNITQIISDAKSSGINLKSYSTLEETTNQNKVSYEFTGDIDQALVFCEKLKKSNKIVECQEASLVITDKIADKNTCYLKCILNFFKYKKLD